MAEIKNSILGIKLHLEGEDIEQLNVGAIANGSANLEAILEKLALANCLNDTADLNFTMLQTNQHKSPKF